MVEESSRFNTWAKNSIKEPPINLTNFSGDDLSKKSNNPNAYGNIDRNPEKMIKVYFKKDS